MKLKIIALLAPIYFKKRDKSGSLLQCIGELTGAPPNQALILICNIYMVKFDFSKVIYMVLENYI